MPVPSPQDWLDSVNRLECPACRGRLDATHARRSGQGGSAVMHCSRCGQRWALVIDPTSVRVEVVRRGTADR